MQTPPAMEGTMEMLSPSVTARRFFLQIADVFVVDVKINEGPQLSVLGI